MNDLNLHIHENLSWLRRANHLTIEEVAGKIGVSRQAVSKCRHRLLAEKVLAYISEDGL